MNEIHLEELLQFHPYLIDRSLQGILPKRQVSKGALRYDLGFETKNGLSLVELKKGELKPKDIHQLLSYCRAWGRSKSKPLAKTHYLIGKQPADLTLLEKARKSTVRDIKILFVGTDIPWYLVLVDGEYRPYIEGYAKTVVHLKL